MMKLSKSFIGNEILVWGCTPPDQLYYKRFYKAATRNGVTVYPMSITQPAGKPDLGFDTYDSLDDLPKVPACAYILADKEAVGAALKRFHELGVKRVIFYSIADVDKADLDACAKMGIEVRVGCPMMLYGAGICAFHGFVAGIKRR